MVLRHGRVSVPEQLLQFLVDNICFPEWVYHALPHPLGGLLRSIPAQHINGIKVNQFLATLLCKPLACLHINLVSGCIEPGDNRHISEVGIIERRSALSLACHSGLQQTDITRGAGSVPQIFQAGSELGILWGLGLLPHVLSQNNHSGELVPDGLANRSLLCLYALCFVYNTAYCMGI